MVNQIETRELKSELKYKNTIILTYKITYPEIVSSDFLFGRAIFNRYNLEKARKLETYIMSELFEDAKKTYDYNAENGYPVMVYEVISSFNMTYNSDFIISLYEDEYQFTGGAHGNTIRNSQTWDLRLGRIVPLSYFYPRNPYYVIDILKQINNQIKEQIANGSNQYFDNYCELVLSSFNLNNFYLLPNEVAIYFQQYDIAPYSSGIPVFYVSR